MAIARHTAVVVNRHPTVMEYMGQDYPFFYDDLEEVHKPVDLTRIKATHDHITSIEKEQFKIEAFIGRFARNLQ
ncbi:hypothetical protein [Palleronia aestuarii]|nr:hypothetical protein [Palleronia aestuarii]